MTRDGAIEELAQELRRRRKSPNAPTAEEYRFATAFVEQVRDAAKGEERSWY